MYIGYYSTFNGLSFVFDCSSNQQLRLSLGFIIKNIKVFCSFLLSKFIALTKLSKIKPIFILGVQQTNWLFQFRKSFLSNC